MNLRLSENSFRFRITPEDLENLLAGQDIDQRMRIGHHCFAYRITPQCAEPEMTLEMAVSGFCLSVPRYTLEVLRDLGKSKSGVSVNQGGVEISLQVDIKTQMKRAA
jgi:hypothetical protein